jgi:ribosomal protein L40E
MANGDSIVYIGILSVVLIIVIYFELRIMRKRFKRDYEEDIAEDSTYNHILATKAASEAVARQGRDTSRADALLLKAEVEFKNGDYRKADDTVNAAKDSLAQAREKLLAMAEAPEAPDEGAQEQESVHAVKKLPKDYLEAKFMISKAGDEIDSAQKEGRDVVEATKMLEEARTAFAADDYTLALKKSINSQKWIGQKLPDTVPAPAEVSKTIVAEKPHYLEQAAEQKCKCGNVLSPDDNFCRRCGAKVPRPYDCPGCGDRVEPDDQFCRRCGKTLKETKPCGSCGAALPPDAESCYACGASVGK